MKNRPVYDYPFTIRTAEGRSFYRAETIEDAEGYLMAYGYVRVDPHPDVTYAGYAPMSLWRNPAEPCDIYTFASVNVHGYHSDDVVCDACKLVPPAERQGRCRHKIR